MLILLRKDSLLLFVGPYVEDISRYSSGQLLIYCPILRPRKNGFHPQHIQLKTVVYLQHTAIIAVGVAYNDDRFQK